MLFLQGWFEINHTYDIYMIQINVLPAQPFLFYKNVWNNILSEYQNLHFRGNNATFSLNFVSPESYFRNDCTDQDDIRYAYAVEHWHSAHLFYFLYIYYFFLKFIWIILNLIGSNSLNGTLYLPNTVFISCFRIIFVSFIHSISFYIQFPLLLHLPKLIHGVVAFISNVFSHFVLMHILILVLSCMLINVYFC